MNSSLVILGLLLVIGYLALYKGRKYGFKHIKSRNVSSASVPNERVINPIYNFSNKAVSLPQVIANGGLDPNSNVAYSTPIVSNSIVSNSSNHKTSSIMNHQSSVSSKNVSDNDDAIKMSVDTIADLFTPKINDAEELGISEEELNIRIQGYQNKYMTATTKSLPQNIYFNTNKYDAALRNSVIDSALSIAKRGSLHNDVDLLQEKAAKHAANTDIELKSTTSNGRVAASASIRANRKGFRIIG